MELFKLGFFVVRLTDVADIGVVAFLLYKMYKLFQRTIVLQVLVAFMLVFVGGVSPDVMKHEGQRWVNTAAKDVVEKGLKNTGEGHGSDAHPAAAPAPAAPPH